MTLTRLSSLLVAGILLTAGPASAIEEPPILRAAVADGTLPPMARRLPTLPAVVDFEDRSLAVGQHGGTLRMLFARAKDIRHIVVLGYARLVCYTPDLEFEPDLLRAIEVEAGRTFTFRLRPGHRWSDGHPFTAEDFRYFWEDIANDPDLSPFGPPAFLVVDGEVPSVRFPDPLTVVYSWSKPNPEFLSKLAGARPPFLYRPAHYLKRFHARHADATDLAQAVEAAGRRDWVALHHALDKPYRFTNPDRPTLQPWVARTEPPSERFVFTRNPYYHRVDPEGRQLPYIDRIAVSIAPGEVIKLKTGAGDADLQARGLSFDDYTFLRAASRDEDYDARLWRTARGSAVALYPNMNHSDPVWRGLFRDVRFRRALSLGIDRDEINKVSFFGLGVPGANTVLERSPLFDPALRDAWSDFDPDRANALLDEIGLGWDDRTRVLPDGRPLEISVETAGEDTLQTDVLELIRDSWARLGIRLFTKPSQREVFRRRIFAGSTQVAVWTGLENGLPTPDMSPAELAPTDQNQLQWPKWGQHHQTDGNAGEPIGLPEARVLYADLQAWRRAATRAEREAIWTRMLRMHADQVFSIGLVSGVLQPVVVNEQLRNVPAEGIYNWDPGAHFGIYRPDLFWFDGPRRLDDPES